MFAKQSTTLLLLITFLLPVARINNNNNNTTTQSEIPNNHGKNFGKRRMILLRKWTDGHTCVKDERFFHAYFIEFKGRDLSQKID